MKIGFLSDVHGNYPALDKVLEHLDTEESVDKKAFLGDAVGYGPYPDQCVSRIVSEFNYIIKGNHDEAITSDSEYMAMNPMAKEAISWTRKNLSQFNRDVLSYLDHGHSTDNNILMMHGSPRAPYEYINSSTSALNGFLNPVRPFDVAFVGHTHVPGVWQYMKNGSLAFIRPEQSTSHENVDEYTIQLSDEDKYIVNVGSVGQPRDNDPRACYIVYDTEKRTLTFYRIPYPIEKTTGRMQQLGFDQRLWMRLIYGQ